MQHSHAVFDEGGGTAPRPTLASRAVRFLAITIFAACTIVIGCLDLLLPQPGFAGVVEGGAVQASGPPTILDGSAFRAFERKVRGESNVRAYASPLYAWLMNLAFGAIDRSVVEGSDGYLFAAARVVPRPESDELLVGRAAAFVAAVSSRIEARGMRLWLLPVPRKEEVLFEALPEESAAVARQGLHQAFVRAARARGVRVVDVWDEFRSRRAADPVYRRIDTHWTMRGSEVAARLVAAALGSEGLDPRYEIVPVPNFPGGGDLRRMAGMLRPDYSGPKFLLEPTTALFVVDRAAVGPVKFVQKAAPDDLALVGTSFSWNGTWMALYLEAHARRRVWDGSAPGQGPYRPMTSLLKRIVSGAAPKDVVWEIPGHSLFCGGLDFVAATELLGALSEEGLVSPWGSERRIDDLFPVEAALGRALPLATKPVIAAARAPRLTVVGDALVWVKLVGRLSGGDARVSTTGGGYRSDVLWPAGAASVAVPILATSALDVPRQRLSIARARGEPVLELTAASIVADAPIPVSTAGTPAGPIDGGWRASIDVPLDGTAAPGASLWVAIDRVPPGAYPLAIRVERGGETIFATTLSAKGPKHDVVFGLGDRFVGAQALRVAIEGKGKLPSDLGAQAGVTSVARP